MRMRRRKETKNAISCLLISRSRRHLDLHRSLTWLPNYPSKHESTKGQSKMGTDSIRFGSKKLLPLWWQKKTWYSWKKVTQPVKKNCTKWNSLEHVRRLEGDIPLFITFRGVWCLIWGTNRKWIPRCICWGLRPYTDDRESTWLLLHRRRLGYSDYQGLGSIRRLACCKGEASRWGLDAQWFSLPYQKGKLSTSKFSLVSIVFSREIGGLRTRKQKSEF